MNIIYEDSKIIVVEKEAGKLTQSGKSFDLDLTSEVLTYRRKKGEAAYAALINRLDRPVSGLVLFAKNKSEAARLSRQMQHGGFCKQYYAIVCGKLPEKSGTFVDYLVKDAASNTSRTADKNEDGAKCAKLKYEVIEEYRGCNECGENKESIEYGEHGGILSLVRIELITGRHHQIRVQFASRGLPILGDGKYGGAAAKQRLLPQQPKGAALAQQMPEIRLKQGEIALCAYSLTADKKTYTVEPHWKQG